MTIREAMAKMTPMWLQLSFIFAIEILMDSISMVIVGKLDDTTILAATGLGFIFLFIFALSTSMGLNTALETLVAQAYGAD
jgi:Na+-driven multidrug efflux pump